MTPIMDRKREQDSHYLALMSYVGSEASSDQQKLSTAQGEMSSLYADYLRERTNDQILETPEGFVTYRFLNDGKTVYIIDIYVIPEARKIGHATELADIVISKAKAKGAVEMIGTVVPTAKNSTTSLKVLLGYGMTLNSASQDLIVFRKEI
jgi:ribosomal protein S18 acetylase RimI-like enzyme